MQIKLTVGICAKNCEKNVKHIVNSIASQDFPHEQIEVFFIEEDSNDGTLSSILTYAPKMKIEYEVYHLKRKGLGFSRNLVLKKARGKYIVWIDDGTIIPENYLSKLFDVMEDHPNIGIATGVLRILSGTSYISSWENMAAIIFSNNYAGKYTNKFPGAGGSIFRIDAMLQVGGFDERITGAVEDTDIAYRISTSGWKIYVEEILYSRDYSNSLSKVWAKGVWYGFGLHFLLHKYKELRITLCKSTPMAGFLEGIISSFNAYKLTHRKAAFFLPIFFSFQRTALCWGFFKAHKSSYGHL